MHRRVPAPTSHLYACLSYATVFCPSHAATHASASAGPGHQITVDVDRAELFCAACGYQVYDPDFDHVVFLAQSSSLLPSTSTSSASASLSLRKSGVSITVRSCGPRASRTWNGDGTG
uniref:UBP-type domain-containing protein n=1 Tax=Zea mays TaxID=4577 RepID=A0A804NRF0_MAIZE